MKKPAFPWWKFFAIWGLFLLLHFSYHAFPGRLFQILGEDHEATYFHMKMLFVAYLVVSAVDWVIRRKTIGSVGDFLTSRGLIAVAYPWIAITFWFTADALGLNLFSTPVVELIYANVTTVIGIYFALRMEEFLNPVCYRPAMRWLVGSLVALAVLSYVSFSLNVPQHFFTTPPY